ncbi:Protein phosphatase 1 regulatory subunit 3D [Leucoagaricus sp. SymC.cos]|nr:Protein phosphatase 1 regulatory subunit 3D [Leucoagaricus sp. SymC.cos]
MITTVIVEHSRRGSSQPDAGYARDSNQAAAPLLIPRRATRSQSSSTSQATKQRPVISATGHDWVANVIDTDSSSSSATSEAGKPSIRTRRKGSRRVRSCASSPPKGTPFLSPPESSASSMGRLPQPQAKPGVFDNRPVRNHMAIVAPRPLVYTPGMLRLSLETIRSYTIADPDLHFHDPRGTPGNGSKSAPPGCGSNDGSRSIIRKKSGEPVKSSLKSSRSARSNLSIVTTCSSSKGEPSTPKVVHFDTQLEHVKLFLAEQKPLAVSRDGSPTDDTSGTDSDFPSFTHGNDDDIHRPRKKLVMRPINMVAQPNLDSNVVLEDFYLNFDGTNILGKVRVRNIAFTKTVVVRFTFDLWQTTSEVTARYVESINPQFDQFSFSIRLNDLLARIEGKTFMMAIRYNVAGQEYWDNNYHQDYVATFTKAKVSWNSKKSDGEDAGDRENLKNKLEQVVLQGEDELTNTVALRSKLRLSGSKETDPLSLESGLALPSRYDFVTSLRNPNTRKPPDVPAWASPPKDARSLSPSSRYIPSPPASVPSSSIPWPEKKYPIKRSATLPASLPSFTGQPSLVSPREFDSERVFTTPSHFIVEPGESTSVASLSISERGRHHQRGFLDAGSVGMVGAVRRTPPGTPPKPVEFDVPPLSSMFPALPTSSRYHSFPPLSNSSDSFGLDPRRKSAGFRKLSLSPNTGFPRGPALSMGESSGDSELSTPSLPTPTSSQALTPSPTDPSAKPALSPLSDDGFSSASGLGGLHPMQPISPGTRYRHFLDK